MEEKDNETIILKELHQHMITSCGVDEEDIHTQVQLKRELENIMVQG